MQQADEPGGAGSRRWARILHTSRVYFIVISVRLQQADEPEALAVGAGLEADNIDDMRVRFKFTVDHKCETR